MVSRPQHPAERQRYQRPYFTIAAFGDGAANPGAAWVGIWYARNQRIFNNLRAVATPGDGFVLYGARHAHFLDTFVRESGVARRVGPRGYIPRR